MSIINTDILKINGTELATAISVGINTDNIKYVIPDGSSAKILIGGQMGQIVEMTTETDTVFDIVAQDVNSFNLVHLKEKNSIPNNAIVAVNFGKNLLSSIEETDGSKSIQYADGLRGGQNTSELKTFDYPFDIKAVSTSSETITVNGNKTIIFAIGDSIDVAGSTGNNGTYTIDDITYSSTTDKTTITVAENITNSVADGTIEFS